MILRRRPKSVISWNRSILIGTALITMFVFGSLSGVIALRNGLLHQVYYILRDIPHVASNFVQQSLTSHKAMEEITLNLNFENFAKLNLTRERNIADGHAVYSDDDWVNGNLAVNQTREDYDVKIRLKGVMSDNWQSDNGRWSFRVKVKGENRLHGLKEFSLVRPEIYSGPLEWIYQIISQNEGLITLRTKLVTLKVNGKDLGLYYMQEHFHKHAVEHNKRREGPIIGYDKDRLISLWETDPYNAIEVDGFRVSDIKITGKLSNKSEEQKRLTAVALKTLENLKQRQKPLGDIIDVELFAKHFAIRAILGSSDLDWKDMKFYYNPMSRKLEPIIREVHADYDIFDWWYRGGRPLDTFAADASTYFEDTFFLDKEFLERYMHYLNIYSKSSISDLLGPDNISDYETLTYHFSTNGMLSKWNDVLEKRRNKISAALGHPAPSSFLYFPDGKVVVRNVQQFPLIVESLEDDKGTEFSCFQKQLVEGKINQENEHFSPLDVRNCNFTATQFENRIYARVKILGSNREVVIQLKEHLSPLETVEKRLYPIENYFVEQDGKLVNHSNSIEIVEKLEFSPELPISIRPGTQIVFGHSGQLIINGELLMNGTGEEPIYLRAQKGSKMGGLYVNAEGGTVQINHVFVFNLPGVYLEDALITGALNIYNAQLQMGDVKIENKIFHEINSTQSRDPDEIAILPMKDDILNVVNSVVDINELEIIGGFSDAFDVDFGRGEIKNLTIKQPGNDGLDFSGSKIFLKNVKVTGAGDKAISIGEASDINGNKIDLESSFIGLAVKDGSKVSMKNISVLDSRVSAAIYKKKPEYGFSEVFLSSYKGEKEGIMLENKNLLEINGHLMQATAEKIFETLYK